MGRLWVQKWASLGILVIAKGPWVDSKGTLVIAKGPTTK